MSRSRTLERALVAALVCSGVAGAQTTTARIVGTVSDSSGAVVPNAAVAVTNLQTGVSRSTTTSSEGTYQVTNLLIGQYSVTAHSTGFKRVERKPVVLEVDQTVRVDLTLAPGETTETIVVEAGSPLVQTDTSGLNQVVTNTTVVQMPVLGRNFMQLATLTAGATEGAPGNGTVRSRSEGVAISVNGQRPEHNNFMLDGVDNNATLFGNAVVVPSLDAVQEFKVQTSSYSAEYGRAGGAVLNVALKSGSNQLHGTLFEFLRNDKLDANGFFNNYFGIQRQALRQNTFGASVGGPVVKNRLFWFANYEGFRRRDISVNGYLVPTAAQRQGDFSGQAPVYDPLTLDAHGNRLPFPDNRIPADRIHPAARRLMDFYPQPNVSGDPTRNYQETLSNPQDRDQFHLRGDWQITSSDSLMARYSWTERGDTAANILYAGQITRNDHQGAAVAWTKVISPSVLNEVRLGITRYSFALIPDGLGNDFASQLGLPSFAESASLQRFPTVTVTNFASFGGNDAIPLERSEDTWQILDQFTWLRAKHSIKLGGDYRTYSGRNYQPQTSAGLYTFDGSFTGVRGRQYANGLPDLLLGLPRVQRILNPTGFDAATLLNSKISLYAQDDWAVAQNLTLNVGLRWERDGEWTEDNHRWATFDYATGEVLYPKDARLEVQLPYPNRRLMNNSLRQAINNNFAPRIGFAWRPFSGNHTVVRGAYGIFWVQPIANVMLQLALNPPYLLRTEAQSGTTNPELRFGVFPSTDASTLVPRVPALTGTIEPGSYVNGYTQQWNFGIEREIVRNFAVKGFYVGSKGTHLERRFEGNPALPPGPGTIQGRRLFPLIGQIVRQASNSFSSYHSLQLTAEKRFSRGLQFTANYTWSKALTDSSGWGGLGGQESAFAQDPSRLFLEKGLAGFNVAHRFASSYFYELPFQFGNGFARAVLGGWQTSGTVAIQSGFPFTITTPGDIANAGTRSARGSTRASSRAPPSIRSATPQTIWWSDPAASTGTPR
jgi:hypothetical protein